MLIIYCSLSFFLEQQFWLFSLKFLSAEIEFLYPLFLQVMYNMNHQWIKCISSVLLFA